MTDTRRIGEIRNQVARVSKSNSLKPAGKKAAAPIIIEEQLTARLPFVAGCHDNKCGKVVGEISKAIGQPRSHARLAGLLGTRVDERDGRIVVDGLGVHALDDRDPIDDRGHVRQQLAHPGAVPSVPLELEHRRDARKRLQQSPHHVLQLGLALVSTLPVRAADHGDP